MVNYLGVLMATIVSFAFGAIWYGPMFGKYWMELAKVPMETNKAKIKKMMITSMTFGFLSQAVTVFAFAYLLSMLNASGYMLGMALGFIIWIGFIATFTLGSVLWEGKSLKLYCFNNAYNLLSYLIIGGIVGAMQ